MHDEIVENQGRNNKRRASVIKNASVTKGSKSV